MTNYESTYFSTRQGVFGGGNRTIHTEKVYYPANLKWEKEPLKVIPLGKGIYKV